MKITDLKWMTKNNRRLKIGVQIFESRFRKKNVVVDIMLKEYGLGRYGNFYNVFSKFKAYKSIYFWKMKIISD